MRPRISTASQSRAVFTLRGLKLEPGGRCRESWSLPEANHGRPVDRLDCGCVNGHKALPPVAVEARACQRCKFLEVRLDDRREIETGLAMHSLHNRTRCHRSDLAGHLQREPIEEALGIRWRALKRGLIQRSFHEETNAEPHLPSADLIESACFVETFCMGISHDVDRCRSRDFGREAAVLHESTPDTSPPGSWLDEQCIQLGIPIIASEDRREPHDCTPFLCDEDPANFDLLER